jgi:integrase
MGVYKKGRFYHYDFIIKGRRWFGSTGQEGKRAAEAVERTRRLEAATGTGADAGDLTVDLAASQYYDEVKAGMEDAEGVLKRLLTMVDCIGNQRLLKEIDAAAISGAIMKRRTLGKKVPAPATINRDIIDHTLRPLLNRARKVWGARSLPVIDWRSVRLKEPKGIVREYSAKEMDAWRDACEDKLERFALDLLLTYGLRFGELFFLPADVDGAAKRLTLRDRKGGDSLTLPLRADHARVLAAMASTRRAHEHVLPFTYWGLYSRLRTAASTAGLGKRAIHGARHHAATTLLRSTGNLALTKRMLGHASIQSTMRYAHANEDDLRAAIENIPPPISPEVETKTSQKPRKIRAK